MHYETLTEILCALSMFGGSKVIQVQAWHTWAGTNVGVNKLKVKGNVAIITQSIEHMKAYMNAVSKSRHEYQLSSSCQLYCSSSPFTQSEPCYSSLCSLTDPHIWDKVSILHLCISVMFSLFLSLSLVSQERFENNLSPSIHSHLCLCLHFIDA